MRDRHYDGIVNIRTRPTFETRTLAIEVHIFGFDEDIYGEEVSIYFIGRIREEKQFAGAQELASQIKEDIATAKALLSKKLHLYDREVISDQCA